jgi:hypothetical protein
MALAGDVLADLELAHGPLKPALALHHPGHRSAY